jgi:two-component system sensor histidine kinase/response regulator
MSTPGPDTLLLAGLLRYAPDGLVLVDADGRITDVNRRAAHMFGYDGDDLVGMPLDFLLPLITPALHTRLRMPPAADVLPPNDSHAYWVQDADGHTFAVEASLSLLPVSGPVQCCVSLRDATARLEAEHALQASVERAERTQAQLIDLSNALPLAIFQYETDPQGQGRYTFVSRRIAEVLDMAVPELLAAPQAWQCRLGQADANAWNAALHTAMAQARAQGNGHLQREMPVQVRGMSRWLQIDMRCAGRKIDDRLLWNGYFADITDTMSVQIGLQQAKELAEDASRMKSEFLANISHEIRTPLNAILGSAQLALREAPQQPLHAHLRRIDAAGQHLLGIVNDMLDFHDIETGQLQLQRADFSLHELLHGLHAQLRQPAATKGLQLSVDMDPALPDTWHGDGTRLRQVLRHYLSNAIEFTEHGSVQLRARPWQAGGREWLRLEVRDTGCGIAPEHLPRVFQAFWQADGSRSRRHGGTGLGLATSRRLVQLMDGETGVESTLGQGALFWLQVPLQPGTTSAAADPAEPAVLQRLRARKGLRVLLVEDNAMNQEIAHELLAMAGVQVDTVDDGQAAVARIAAQAARYQLVLMDLQMPVMDGLTATGVIRRQWSAGQLPIVALTANAQPQDVAACQAAGMQDLVPKPILPERLWEALLRWTPASLPAAPPAAGAHAADRARSDPLSTLT